MASKLPAASRLMVMLIPGSDVPAPVPTEAQGSREDGGPGDTDI